MLEYLFSNKNVEKILIYLLFHESVYASEMSKVFNSALDPIQKTLRKLENGGLLVSFTQGKTRIFKWNPRYPFLKEIKALAKKAYEYLPSDHQKVYDQKMKRQRPRKTGKPI